MIPEMLNIMAAEPRVLSTTGSVGQGGQNNSADVRLVQNLLNAVPVQCGGPSIKLSVDGVAGPKTIAAISRYQSVNLGSADGLVDARNTTIRHLVGLVLSRQSIPDQPGLSTASTNDTLAVRSLLGSPFPNSRGESQTAVRSSLVGASNPGFGAPFTASGWTINNNAASFDISVKDTGAYSAVLEIFQDADPSVKARLLIAGGFKSISPKAGLPFGADISLPSFNSTQGKIIRGLLGFTPISKYNFIGLCQFGFIGLSWGTLGRSMNLFQFGWTPSAVPGSCLGFAVMVGDQMGIPGMGVGGGTGICTTI